MKKVLSLAVAATMLFAAQAYARIVVECDDYNDSVNYRSYKTVGAYGITEYAFIKSTKENEKDEYYLRLSTSFRNHSSKAARYLTGKKVDVIADGVTYSIPKVLDNSFPRPFEMFNCALPFSFYRFTDEAISAMQNSSEIKFVINTLGKDTNTIIVNQSNRNEFNRMYKLKFQDYTSDNINEGL